MLLDEFLGKHGLTGDPFAHTNAEDEELLADYFVPPPYFPAVLGKPSQPKSAIVFAPRGGGKTAQRRMLEENSRLPNSEYMCVLYDHFPENVKSGQPSTDEHINQICLRIVLGILVDMDREDYSGQVLAGPDRDFLCNESALLDSLDLETFNTIAGSFKSGPRKMADWLRGHSGPVKGIVAALLAKRGIQLDPTIPWAPQMTTARQSPPRARLERLLHVCNNLGFSSVYVLIDKLDETPTTSTSPKRAIEMISNLLLDLPVMEMAGLGIKVFAWDQSQDHYHELGGRQDRIREFALEWKPETLAAMMSRRLGAYSGNMLSTLNALLEPASDVDFQLLTAHLASGSPRDMIRICGHVVSEHLNTGGDDALISEDSIWRGVRKFSDEICLERARKFLPDLMRLESYRFTQNQVASDYLKVSKQSTQAKVSEWRKTAMIDKITEIQDKRRRPQHVYGVSDPRLAIHLRPSISPRDILEFFAFQCGRCGAANYSEENLFICRGCQDALSGNTSISIMSLCVKA